MQREKGCPLLPSCQLSHICALTRVDWRSPTSVQLPAKNQKRNTNKCVGDLHFFANRVTAKSKKSPSEPNIKAKKANKLRMIYKRKAKRQIIHILMQCSLTRLICVPLSADVNVLLLKADVKQEDKEEEGGGWYFFLFCTCFEDTVH